jgi:hypothetical protein
MTEPTGRRARRRRRRATSPGGPPPERATAAEPAASGPVAAVEPPPAKRGAKKSRPDSGDRDRGLRSLVGAGPSQLGVDGALRGRDVNRPTEGDLAEAERDVVIVRRHWAPPK